MHSPVEVLDLEDVAVSIDLITKAIGAMDDGFALLPKQP
jgi:putative aminopeptidase FrvX